MTIIDDLKPILAESSDLLARMQALLNMVSSPDWLLMDPNYVHARAMFNAMTTQLKAKVNVIPQV